MDSIRHINYKSDFIVRECFRDAAGGTRFYKTVTVQVVAPALRLAAPGVLRLDSAGNIRLT